MALFQAVEMSPDAMDNRPLGRSGQFLAGAFSEKDVAIFPSAGAALRAAAVAPNARKACEVHAVAQGRRVRA